jgi:hypothetical protein
MSPDHIEMSEYCLCDDCTRGYTLPTPRIRDSKDIEYALAKMKHELSGAAGWTDRDYAAALGAMGAKKRAKPRAVGENEVGGMSVEEWGRNTA